MLKNIKKPALYAAIAASTLWAAGTSAHADGATGLQDWVAGAGKAIEKTMRYPKMAAARGEEGTAGFKVTIDRAGNVVDAEKNRSSGSGFINAAAYGALKRAKFPALPASLDKDELTFSLRLTYAIAGSASEKRALERQGYVTGREVASASSPVFASIQIEDDTAAD